MKITTSYAVEVRHPGKMFRETIAIYRDMEAFFADVANREWTRFDGLTQNNQLAIMERITHKTKSHPEPAYDFDGQFSKIPSYLRRAAIRSGIGRVSSYKSNYANWESNGKKGSPPVLPKCAMSMPCFYNSNMYKETDDPTEVSVKLYNGKDWIWCNIKILRTDIQYIQRHCALKKKSAPTLESRHGKYFLRFSFEEKMSLYDTNIKDQIICAVDLGLNTDATCSVMRSDGTILARKFISFPCDKDHLYKTLGRVKRLSRECSPANSGALWRYAKAINEQLSYKIAVTIVDFAIQYSCDAIIFEYLDTKKKRKKGKNKQRLAFWAHQAIQNVATTKAHQNAIHVYRVNAWGTSALAFDGSGQVLRGEKAELASYSLCRFQTGKVYNCDLNASYNIGARYFVRELMKTLPATVRSQVEAKVPGCEHRTSCTLNTLLEYHAFFAAKAA